MEDHGPHPVDIHVGARVRLRRMLKGLSQEKLADALGITFQQVQKYEKGANRIGASRLFDLSRVLDVGVAYFFDDYESAGSSLGFAEPGTSAPMDDMDVMSQRETLDLVRAYYQIPDKTVRKSVIELVRSLAKKAGTAA